MRLLYESKPDGFGVCSSEQFTLYVTHKIFCMNRSKYFYIGKIFRRILFKPKLIFARTLMFCLNQTGSLSVLFLLLPTHYYFDILLKPPSLNN